MPGAGPDPLWLAHVGGELGTTHIVVLAAVGIVANAILLAPRAFGLFLKGPLRRALEEVAGPDARLGSIALPLRGSLSVSRVEIPDLPKISHVEAEVDLLGLRRDPVAIPRIVLTRLSDEQGSPEARVEEPRRLDGPSSQAPTAGDRPLPGLRLDGSASEGRLYEVSTIVIRSGGSDETELEGSEGSSDGSEIRMPGPGYPIDLDGLVRHLVRQVRAAPHDPAPAPEAGPQ